LARNDWRIINRASRARNGGGGKYIREAKRRGRNGKTAGSLMSRMVEGVDKEEMEIKVV
jgi:hypothetical protein